MQRNNKKRGMTMAELCVAMAVISIVATMVVSFSVLISERSKSATSKQETITDINLIESIVEDWIKANKDKTIYFSEDGNSWSDLTDKYVKYMKVSGNEDLNLSFTGHKTLILNGQEIPLSDNIDAVTFSGVGNKLYYCKIEYTVFDTGETEYYTFCVNTALPD